MAIKNREMAKIDPVFKQELDQIKMNRIASGKDNPNNPKSNARLTAAIRRHNLWNRMKEDIINADLKEDIR